MRPIRDGKRLVTAMFFSLDARRSCAIVSFEVMEVRLVHESSQPNGCDVRRLRDGND